MFLASIYSYDYQMMECGPDLEVVTAGAKLQVLTNSANKGEKSAL